MKGNTPKSVQKIRNFFSEPASRYGLCSLIIFIAIATILVIITINTRIKVEPTLKIDNFSEVLPNVPESSHKIIEQKLYQQAKEALGEGKNPPTSGALIRQDSLYSFNIKDSFYVGDFIVDIDSIHQSYIIKYFYGNLNNGHEMEISASVQLFCLENPDIIIYDDFDCKNSTTAYLNFSHDNPLSYILPQNFSSQNYSLNFTVSNTSSSGYAIIIQLDPPESVYRSSNVKDFTNKKIEEAKKWLEDNGLNPDDYEFIKKYKIIGVN